MRRSLTMTCLLGGVLALSVAARGQDSVENTDRRAPSVASANSAEQHIAAGLASYLKRRFPEAERHFRAAVDADPRSASAHYYLAYSIYKIAEPKRPNDPGKHRAAEEFAKAYEIDPGFQPAWRVLVGVRG